MDNDDIKGLIFVVCMILFFIGLIAIGVYYERLKIVPVFVKIIN